MENENVSVETQDENQELDNQEIENEAETKSVSDEDESDESESEESENSEDESNGDEDKRPKKNSFKKRIDKLKRREEDALREVEYWKREALKEKQRESERVVEAPKNTGKPSADDFDSHDEYVEALTDWKVEQALKNSKEESIRKTQQEKQVEVAKNWQQKVENFADEYPDFEDVIEQTENIKISNAIRDALLECEIGPHVLYEISKNPKEAERIASLSDASAIREIGKIEAKLLSLKAKEKKINKTKAPNPIGSVRGGAVYEKDPSKMSFTEYEAWRKKQLK